MKAKLIFDLEDRFDEEAHLRAVKSLDLAMVIYDMDQYLRSQTKYAPDSMSSEVYDALEAARDKLHEIMSERSIDLDKLVS
jgi:hypothetical protein